MKPTTLLAALVANAAECDCTQADYAAAKDHADGATQDAAALDEHIKTHGAEVAAAHHAHLRAAKAHLDAAAASGTDAARHATHLDAVHDHLTKAKAHRAAFTPKDEATANAMLGMAPVGPGPDSGAPGPAVTESTGTGGTSRLEEGQFRRPVAAERRLRSAGADGGVVEPKQDDQITGRSIHLGALAKADFRNGKNPAGWAVDEPIWERAKTAALKSYDVGDDAYWPVVAHIYESMGGTVKGEHKKANVSLDLFSICNEQGRDDRGRFAEGDHEDHRRQAERAGNRAIAFTSKNRDNMPEFHQKAASLHREAEVAHSRAADSAPDKATADEHRSWATTHGDIAKQHERAAKAGGLIIPGSRGGGAKLGVGNISLSLEAAIVANAAEDQPRDESGKWTSTGKDLSAMNQHELYDERQAQYRAEREAKTDKAKDEVHERGRLVQRHIEYKAAVQRAGRATDHAAASSAGVMDSTNPDDHREVAGMHREAASAHYEAAGRALTAQDRHAQDDAGLHHSRVADSHVMLARHYEEGGTKANANLFELSLMANAEDQPRDAYGRWSSSESAAASSQAERATTKASAATYAARASGQGVDHNDAARLHRDAAAAHNIAAHRSPEQLSAAQHKVAASYHADMAALHAQAAKSSGFTPPAAGPQPLESEQHTSAVTKGAQARAVSERVEKSTAALPDQIGQHEEAARLHDEAKDAYHRAAMQVPHGDARQALFHKEQYASSQKAANVDLSLANADLAKGAEVGLVLGSTLPDGADLANATAAPDGWSLIAKYGDHPHPGMPGKEQPVLQRFDHAAAEEIVANFKSTWGRFKRFLIGLPIFNGHPDVPGLERFFPDKETKGTYSDLRAGELGLEGRSVMTANGAKVIESGHDRTSPYWFCRALGELTANGLPIVSPFKLLSVGLVDRANIPGPSLMNAFVGSANDNPESRTMNNERTLLIQLLAALGQNVSPTVGDTDLANAVQTAISQAKVEAPDKAANSALLTALKAAKVDTPEKLAEFLAQGTTLSNAKATAEAAKTTAETAKTAAETALANAKAELTVAKDATAGERKAHALRIANAAVTAGIIPPGERDQWVAELCNGDLKALDAKAKELATKKPADKVKSSAMKLGNVRSAAAVGNANFQKIQDGVRARMRDRKETYETAYANFAADPVNAELFADLKGPRITPGRAPRA